MSTRWEQAVRVLVGVGLVALGVRAAQGRAPIEHSVTPVPPLASASATVAPPPSTSEAEEVAFRLTELLGQAQVDMPQMQRGLGDLTVHWRRMQAPWKDTLRHPRARLVQLVALRTSAAEVPHTVTMKTGEKVTFDVRQWNMAEGSYAEREAIVAPTPASLRYRLVVPPHAALSFDPAVLGVGEGAKGRAIGDVTFVTTVHGPGGGAEELGRVTVGTLERDRWGSVRYDLSRWSGKEIELELRTEATPNKHPEKAAPKDGEKDDDKPAVAAGPLPPALALIGAPRITRRGPTRLPYSVLWIVVDSLRPDVIASFHDPAVDAKKLAAKRPPGDTLLPAIPGLTPHLDALAKRGVVYRDAISAAPWTRPGTLAMLSGVHSREMGLSPLPWIIPEPMLDAYYRSEPPLLALSMRRAGARTDAIVNNNFMLGYAAVGVDMGFERVDDFRYRTADTHEVTQAALATLRAHKDERFFYFVNYNSPHDPYDPPPECVARVPKPPVGPKDDSVARYMAEACKDDAAIGVLMAELDALGLREKTLVVVTADHGETLSQAHEFVAEGLDGVNTRFHHAFAMYEETTRIPILLSLPGVVPEGKVVDGRVTNLDLAPTVASVLRLEKDPRWQGLDLVALAKSGQRAPDRPIVTLGRASAAIFWGKHRYALRDHEARKVTLVHQDHATIQVSDELFDLDEDPGETKSLAGSPAHAAIVKDLRARLELALATKKQATEEAKQGAAPLVMVRFAGAGKVRRVIATITVKGGKSLAFAPFGIPKEAVVPGQAMLKLDAVTAKEALVGLDLEVVPELAPVEWTFRFDDKTLLDDMVFGGPLGVTVPGLARGILDAGTRTFAGARAFPFVDPTIDDGVFVVRIGGDQGGPERVAGGAAAAEVQSALKQWGYAK